MDPLTIIVVAAFLVGGAFALAPKKKKIKKKKKPSFIPVSPAQEIPPPPAPPPPQPPPIQAPTTVQKPPSPSGSAGGKLIGSFSLLPPFQVKDSPTLANELRDPAIIALGPNDYVWLSVRAGFWWQIGDVNPVGPKNQLVRSFYILGPSRDKLFVFPHYKIIGGKTQAAINYVQIVAAPNWGSDDWAQVLVFDVELEPEGARNNLGFTHTALTKQGVAPGDHVDSVNVLLNRLAYRFWIVGPG